MCMHIAMYGTYVYAYSHVWYICHAVSLNYTIKLLVNSKFCLLKVSF